MRVHTLNVLLVFLNFLLTSQSHADAEPSVSFDLRPEFILASSRLSFVRSEPSSTNSSSHEHLANESEAGFSETQRLLLELLQDFVKDLPHHLQWHLDFKHDAALMVFNLNEIQHVKTLFKRLASLGLRYSHNSHTTHVFHVLVRGITTMPELLIEKLLSKKLH